MKICQISALRVYLNLKFLKYCGFLKLIFGMPCVCPKDKSKASMPNYMSQSKLCSTDPNFKNLKESLIKVTENRV